MESLQPLHVTFFYQQRYIWYYLESSTHNILYNYKSPRHAFPVYSRVRKSSLSGAQQPIPSFKARSMIRLMEQNGEKRYNWNSAISSSLEHGNMSSDLRTIKSFQPNGVFWLNTSELLYNADGRVTRWTVRSTPFRYTISYTYLWALLTPGNTLLTPLHHIHKINSIKMKTEDSLKSAILSDHKLY